MWTHSTFNVLENKFINNFFPHFPCPQSQESISGIRDDLDNIDDPESSGLKAQAEKNQDLSL